jgi:hypothetical protein
MQKDGWAKYIQNFAFKFSNSMQRIKSAKLAISDLALLIPCMEFEFFWVQIPSFEVFSM